MEKRCRENRLDTLILWLLPIAFVGPVFLNMLIFVVDGHRHESLRMAFVWGVQAITAILLFGKAISLWKKAPSYRKLELAAAAIPLLLGILYICAIAMWPNKAVTMKEMVINECYLVEMICAMLMIIIEKRLRQFLEITRVYSVISAPIILYYCIRLYLPSADYLSINLGTINYMSLGYYLLDMSFFLVLIPLLYPET